MQTLLQILNKTTEFFQSKEIEDPRLNAEQILAHGLKMRRMELYLNYDRPLSQAELDQLRPLVSQRGQRVPLQHILGTVGWRFLELKTDARALIPRSDTEGIVDLAKKLLQGISSPKILEIGVGSGAISLALATEMPHSKIFGVDLSLDALSLAQENAALNQVSSITWIHSDLYDAVAEREFDLIISNPPYIPSAVVDALEPEVRQHDPRMALDGGKDGLDIYRRMLSESIDLLKEQAYLLCEIGFDQVPALQNLQCNQLEFQGFEKDLGGQDRFVWWQAKRP